MAPSIPRHATAYSPAPLGEAGEVEDQGSCGIPPAEPADTFMRSLQVQSLWALRVLCNILLCYLDLCSTISVVLDNRCDDGLEHTKHTLHDCCTCWGQIQALCMRLLYSTHALSSFGPIDAPKDDRPKSLPCRWRSEKGISQSAFKSTPFWCESRQTHSRIFHTPKQVSLILGVALGKGPQNTGCNNCILFGHLPQLFRTV